MNVATSLTRRPTRSILWCRYANLGDHPQTRDCRAVAAVRGPRGGRATSTLAAAIGKLVDWGCLWCAELRAGTAGVRTAALLARPCVADRKLDADRRAATQRARRLSRADPSPQPGAGRARGLRRIFQPADRRATRRLRVFLDGCYVSAFGR